MVIDAKPHIINHNLETVRRMYPAVRPSAETPPFQVGYVDTNERVTAEVRVEPEEPNLLGRLLRAPNEAHLRSLSAVSLASDAVRRVPLSEACGEYVDWYRAG